MKPNTKLWIIGIFSLLAVLALLCGVIVVKYHVNKERFPNAPSWTWWW